VFDFFIASIRPQESRTFWTAISKDSSNLITESTMQNHSAHPTPSHPARLTRAVKKGWARRGLQLFFVFAVAFFGGLQSQVAACQQNGGATTPPGATASPDSTNYLAGSPRPDKAYIIGADDILVINVWKETELTRTIPVRSDGRISLPLIGDIQAAGRTPMELEEDISARLKNFITNPQVAVIVQQINSQKFNILGQITKPGSYPLTAGTTIVDAIAVAGGFKDFAKKKGVYLLRQSSAGVEQRFNFNYDKFIKEKNTTQNIRLMPNDTIVVP
jgi:polysaccharide export outer membrane protein